MEYIEGIVFIIPPFFNWQEPDFYDKIPVMFSYIYKEGKKRQAIISKERNIIPFTMVNHVASLYPVVWFITFSKQEIVNYLSQMELSKRGEIEDLYSHYIKMVNRIISILRKDHVVVKIDYSVAEQMNIISYDEHKAINWNFDETNLSTKYSMILNYLLQFVPEDNPFSNIASDFNKTTLFLSFPSINELKKHFPEGRKSLFYYLPENVNVEYELIPIAVKKKMLLTRVIVIIALLLSFFFPTFNTYITMGREKIYTTANMWTLVAGPVAKSVITKKFTMDTKEVNIEIVVPDYLKLDKMHIPTITISYDIGSP